MPRFGLCGAFNTLQAQGADIQALVNLYPEIVDSGAGRAGTKVYLVGTQGLQTKWTLPMGPSRAEATLPFSFPTDDRVFTVSGTHLYELTKVGGYADRGFVNSDGYAAFIVTNGIQLAVASAEGLYILDLADNTLTGPILDSEGDQVKPITLAYMNGYMLYTQASSRKIHFSAPFDALLWDPLDFFVADAEPENVLSLITSHNELWVVGDTTAQPYTPTGDANDPFQPVQSGIVMQGLASITTMIAMDNSIFFVGKDHEHGGPVCWRTAGYTVKRVSNTAIENVFSKYPKDALTTGQGFGFVDKGHPVWQLSFRDPSVDETWRYDASLPPELAWYQVGEWDPVAGRFRAHKATTHTYGFGRHIVGSGSTDGKVYDMSSDFLDDDGVIVRRVRRTPHLAVEDLTLFFEKLEVVVEAGLAADGTDPQIMIRWSDDGGQTWGNEEWLSMGKTGQFRWRLMLRRLGRSRDRVFELVFTEQTWIRIIDGYISYKVGKPS